MLQIENIPCWYLSIAIVWSIYQGIRGIIEHRYMDSVKEWERWRKIIVLDMHDFVFRFVCTMAGFLALFVSYHIVEFVTDFSKISTGATTLLVLFFLIGVIGVGGQLHHLILLGKVPK
jgi:hypothetical protein